MYNSNPIENEINRKNCFNSIILSLFAALLVLGSLYFWTTTSHLFKQKSNDGKDHDLKYYDINTCTKNEKLYTIEGPKGYMQHTELAIGAENGEVETDTNAQTHNGESVNDAKSNGNTPKDRKSTKPKEGKDI